MAMKIMDISLNGLAGDMGLTGMLRDIYSTSCKILTTAASRVVICISSACIAASEEAV
jgi:hypothetical protein